MKQPGAKESPNVLVVHNRYIYRGGEDECMEAECKMLRSRGHKVVEHVRENSEIDLASRAKVAFRSIWSSTDYQQIRQLITKEHIDLVHVHNFLPLISPSVFCAASDEGVPIVHTLHNYRQACPGAQFYRNESVCEDCLGKRFAWPGIVHGCYRRSGAATACVAMIFATHRALGTWTSKVSAYLVVSEFMRGKLVSAGLPTEKIFLKPNFAPDRGVGDGRGGYALYVGRLSAEKGISVLLSAWEQPGQKIPLKIAGNGPLQPLVLAKSAQNRSVEYLGSLCAEQVSDLMHNALALIVPSQWYECAPRVIIEALSKGTPVVASDLGGMKEMVLHERCGLLFPAGDAVALKQSVLRLMQDPRLQSRLRIGARDRFLANYTEEQNYELLSRIYQRLLSRDALSANSAA